jgi:hypothetical protein
MYTTSSPVKVLIPVPPQGPIWLGSYVGSHLKNLGSLQPLIVSCHNGKFLPQASWRSPSWYSKCWKAVGNEDFDVFDPQSEWPGRNNLIFSRKAEMGFNLPPIQPNRDRLFANLC